MTIDAYSAASIFPFIYSNWACISEGRIGDLRDIQDKDLIIA